MFELIFDELIISAYIYKLEENLSCQWNGSGKLWKLHDFEFVIFLSPNLPQNANEKVRFLKYVGNLGFFQKNFFKKNR